jgi:hypothetical protein
MTMSLRNALLSLAALSLLSAPLAARADDDTDSAQADELSAQHWGQDSGRNIPGGTGWGNGNGWNSDQRGNWDNDMRTQPVPQQPPRSWPNRQGRYELQTVQRWVPGGYESVWVPESCRFRPRLGRTVCQGGFYDQRWVPGHYETAQEWVWVPHRPRRGFTVTVGG